MSILLLFLGGALGAVARFWVTRTSAALLDRSSLPYGTLAVNLLGSALLGCLLALFPPDLNSPITDQRLLLGAVGFCGALTTFSSFTTETIALLSESKRKALLYLVLTIAGSIGLFAFFFFLMG